MSDQENIQWIIDRMATIVEQMKKMQENIAWLIGQLMMLEEKKR